MKRDKSQVEEKIHDLRVKIQSLNHRRQACADFTEARSHQTTANNIFNETLKQIEGVSVGAKKPVQELTVQLIELTDESKRKHPEEMLVRLSNLERDIQSLAQSLQEDVCRVKQKGMEHIMMVLSNCLDEGNVAPATSLGALDEKENAANKDTEIRHLEDELTLEKQRSEEEEIKQAQIIMKLEAELEATRRRLLHETKEKEELSHRLQERIAQALEIVSHQSGRLKLFQKFATYSKGLLEEGTTHWLLGELHRIMGIPATRIHLLFAASRNNFDHIRFHRFCDHERNLLLVAKCAHTPQVFGSFTDQPYGSQSTSAKSFVFSAANHCIGMLPSEHPTTSIDVDCGPIIGGANGLKIHGNTIYCSIQPKTLAFDSQADCSCKLFPIDCEESKLAQYEVYAVYFD